MTNGNHAVISRALAADAVSSKGHTGKESFALFTEMQATAWSIYRQRMTSAGFNKPSGDELDFVTFWLRHEIVEYLLARLRQEIESNATKA